MNLVDASDGVDSMVVFPVLVGRGMCIQDKAGGPDRGRVQRV